MNYKQIEEYSETDNGLEVILAEVFPTFEMIDKFRDELKEPGLDGNSIAEIMKQSNGIWSELHVIAAILDTVKTNKEKRHFHTQKIEIEKAGGKFNASATEGEASALTIPLRRVRNIITAYEDCALTNITTGQSLLKHLQESAKKVNVD